MKSSLMVASRPIFVVMGLNHHQCPVEVREQVSKWSAGNPDLCNQLIREVGFSEAMLLSTCNRFEVVGVVLPGDGSLFLEDDGAEAVKDRCRSFFCEQVGLNLDSYIFSLHGEPAVRHFFRVTSSLDSLVVGEGQITGQVKMAYAHAQSLGTTGKHLHRLAQCALSVSKKVKANTRIAEKAVSVSYIAVKLAEQIFGSLASCNVLVLGSGRMAELAVLHLAKRGSGFQERADEGGGSIVIANRTEEKAAELARRVGGIGISLSEVPLYLPKADVVIGSVTSDRPMIEVAAVRKLRRQRPLFFIDLGIPRNFPSALAGIEGVYLYNVDDLSSIVDENRQIREDAANDAEVIIEYGLYQFGLWLERLDLEPETLSLRQQIQLICERELEKTMPGLRMEEPLLIDGIVDRISSKVAHVTQQALQHRVGARNGGVATRGLVVSSGNQELNVTEASLHIKFGTSPEQELDGWDFSES